MNKIFIIILLFIAFSCYTFGQESKKLVAETSIKIKSLSRNELFFGFDAGDKIIVNLEMVKGKHIKEFGIYKYPNFSLFMDFKTKEINNKEISIKEKGVYKFEFRNSSIFNRICKIKIERVPNSIDNINFNTDISWENIVDTVYYSEDENYIISKDTSIVNITDQVVKVHSSTNNYGNKTSFNFKLPENTIAWSYYVGVNQEGQVAFDDAVKELSKISSPFIFKMPGYGPLAALALDSAPFIANLQKGEDINFYIVEGNNVNYFLNGTPFYYIKKGMVINDFSKMEPNFNNLNFCFFNDNAITSVLVTVKITAIIVKENWGKRKIKKVKLNKYKRPYLNE